MDSLQLKLCDIQGRLFELSAEAGLDSAVFIKTFMQSEVASALDSNYNRMQWAGEEYLLEELQDVCRNELISGGEQYSKAVLFWIGYLTVTGISTQERPANPSINRLRALP